MSTEQPTLNNNLQGKELDLSLIPVISLANYEQNRAQIADQIKNACENSGFLYLQHTGLEDRVQTVFRYSQQMFATLTHDQKRRFAMRETSGNRGYCLNASEELQKGIIDNKEAFNVTNPDTDHIVVDNGTYWPSDDDLPEDIKDFKHQVQSFFDACHDFVSQKLLNCLAVGLGWDEDFFQLNHRNKAHTLRLLHYPPPPSSANNGDDNEYSIAAGEHSDYGTITLLFQDDIGGLQVLNRENDWVNVTPIEGTIVVNIGDLLQKWTDGRYVSTKHRVVQRKTSSDRYSIACFIHPDPDTVVKDMTAIEYLMMRLNATHTY